LEVNYNPSLSANTPLDWKIKSEVIHDTFKILNVTHENKMKTIKKEKNLINKRLITGNSLSGISYIERKYFKDVN
jgi:hypothetical protein